MRRAVNLHSDSTGSIAQDALTLISAPVAPKRVEKARWNDDTACTIRALMLSRTTATSLQATPTSKGTAIKMESFALWQVRVAENKANDDRAAVLFLAYQSVSESQAIAAGLELVGTTWDISGVQVKAYKQKPAGAVQYGCVVCGVNSKHYQGMYCCGKKRVAVS